MKITELIFNQGIIVQLVLDEQQIEFKSKIIERSDKGVYITPFLYKNEPFELNISNSSKAVCNIFADDDGKKRVSWRNVDLKTVNRNNMIQYYVETSSYNQISQSDERRTHDRMKIHKNGSLYDANKDAYYDIMIHDVSDVGISFYAPPSYQPTSNKLMVLLDDTVNDRRYSVKVNCSIVRNEMKNGLSFFACKTIGDNKDYLFYCFFKKLASK